VDASSLSIDHDNLTNVTASQHHTKYTDAEAVAAVEGTVKLDDLASPDDNTDLNVSISTHGLCPKLNNVATDFLNGQGGWSAPTAGTHALGAGQTDVTITSVADNELLAYDSGSGEWINQTATEAGIIKYTDAEAITAVEGESTLYLTGQVRITNALAQLTLISTNPTTGNVTLALLDKDSAVQTFMAYSPVQHFIYLGDVSMPLTLMGSKILCQGKMFEDLGIADVAPSFAHCLWRYADGQLAIVRASLADCILGSDYKMKFPSSGTASSHYAYFDSATGELKIHNGVDYVVFTGK